VDFGWTGKAFWIITVVAILGTVWWTKRGRDDPPGKN